MVLAGRTPKGITWRARGEYRSLEGSLGAAVRLSRETGCEVVQVARGDRAFLLFASNDPAPSELRVVAFVKAHQDGKTTSKAGSASES